jgi:hypothetical protein
MNILKLSLIGFIVQERMNTMTIKHTIRERMKKYHEPIVKNFGFGITTLDKSFLAFGYVAIWIVLVMSAYILYPLM